MSPVETEKPVPSVKIEQSAATGGAMSPPAPIEFGMRLFSLSQNDFNRVARLVYRICGIHLKDGKQDLVKARLGRRVRSLGLTTFGQYFDLVESDSSGLELAEMVDLLTTNKTEFFRDAAHFEFMKRKILPLCASPDTRVRFWCAGCSTGQEPYSLAIVTRESLRDLSRRDCRILATDICRPALDSAREGKYAETDMEGMPAEYRSRYFARTEPGFYRAASALRELIHFARLNLVEPWPMKGPFQLIMCRNVMIYFDRETREEVVNRFWNLLAPGGYLMVGLSESLTGLRQPFKYVQPAVYRKE